MQKLISIDLFADFGMLKKPDTNEPVYLTFNMLHKPALLGILGAIIGLEGFKTKGELPEYYKKLKDLKIGIEPLQHKNGNFQKTVLKYNNTTGFANKSEENSGATLNIEEQFLIAPAFRCYFYFDENIDPKSEEKIYNNLKKNHAEYLPYLGKNEFSVWWENYKEYDKVEKFETVDSFKINSIYIKDQPIKNGKDIQPFNPIFTPDGNTFSYFEHLPIGYDEKLFQYEYRNFAFTNWSLKIHYQTNYKLLKINSNEIIQVF